MFIKSGRFKYKQIFLNFFATETKIMLQMLIQWFFSNKMISQMQIKEKEEEEDRKKKIPEIGSLSDI